MTIVNKTESFALEVLNNLSLNEIIEKFPFAWALYEKLKERDQSVKKESQIA